jgi:hypothetical protein
MSSAEPKGVYPGLIVHSPTSGEGRRRIYAVRRGSEIVGLIRAGNPSQAVRHVVKQDFSATVAEQEELVSTITGGMKGAGRRGGRRVSKNAQAAFVEEVGEALVKITDAGITIGYKPDGPFNLEADPPPGKLPDRVIDELMHARRVAQDYAQSWGEAVKAQAEKYKINKGALKRYIAARVDDKLQEVGEEADDLARLLDKSEG